MSYPTDFPISEIISELKKKLSQRNTLVVHAPPGAGKSTFLPITLIKEPWNAVAVKGVKTKKFS